MGRSWGLLGPILGVLGRSWGDLGASWGAQGLREVRNLTGGSAVRARRRGLPSILLSKLLQYLHLQKDLRKFLSVIYNTLPVAAQGAADLERPAGGDRRPLAGIFRVRGLPGNCCSDVVHDGISTCSGILGVAF